MDERKIKIEIPTGVEKLADLGNGIIVAMVQITLIREQDKNAQVMKPEMFRQLTENIKNRGTLESLPFCALTDRGVEMISGHHRLRASKEAQLKAIPVLLDITGLSRSKIAAKQIAHNAINGFSDPSTLKEIAKLISDVDDMIESYIGKEILGEPMAQIEKLISPLLNYEWHDVQFIFLPHQIKDIERLMKMVKTNERTFTGFAPIEIFDKFMETLLKYQQFSNIKNVGASIHAMIETTNKIMDESGFDEKDEWVPISRLIGNAAIPKKTADELKLVIEDMESKNLLEKGKKWQGLNLLIEKYRSN